ncbi:hypothetical protein [Desulforhabdus amnigena]|jgi:hypothetical protein|uniref:Secreted protein n=1 Tax=Desulforhabdus amnigena TaxID=40218 RepID=A0A9W6D501_9BACT|nr:hypothetical protein [Desulforhabdus amnigena]NLJ26668.1 hypothetical protein [Deltaproteobacteria bacterium]GLI33326.1 hypothetical protein DAMNIGENAA_07590 [Desulforhabdus amnigena]
MKFAQFSIAAMLLTSLGLICTSSSFAGEKLAFRNGFLKTIPSNCVFKKCASVQIVPPSNGYVIVTASGMASFANDVSFLELTLGTEPGSAGPWLYRVTPGFRLFQNFSVRYVFPVKTNGTKIFTYYLNGRLCRGPSSDVSVETGTITAEFYSSSDATMLSQPQAQIQSTETGTNLQVNKP